MRARSPPPGHEQQDMILTQETRQKKTRRRPRGKAEEERESRSRGRRRRSRLFRGLVARVRRGVPGPVADADDPRLGRHALPHRRVPRQVRAAPAQVFGGSCPKHALSSSVAHCQRGSRAPRLSSAASRRTGCTEARQNLRQAWPSRGSGPGTSGPPESAQSRLARHTSPILVGICAKRVACSLADRGVYSLADIHVVAYDFVHYGTSQMLAAFRDFARLWSQSQHHAGGSRARVQCGAVEGATSHTRRR